MSWKLLYVVKAVLLPGDDDKTRNALVDEVLAPRLRHADLEAVRPRRQARGAAARNRERGRPVRGGDPRARRGERLGLVVPGQTVAAIVSEPVKMPVTAVP